MSTDTRPILVTGATGQTGAATVRHLIACGHAVRALVHADDGRARDLAALDARVTAGDLLDARTVTSALNGVRGAYFVYPIREGLLEATVTFTQAAAEAGLGAVVNLSQVSARPGAASNAARQRWLAERVLDWAPVGAVHLRPNLFAEWLSMHWHATNVGGLLRLPFGTGRHAPSPPTT